MAYTYTDPQVELTTIVEDEQLAAALQAAPPSKTVYWRTIEDEWNDDLSVRRIIKAEITRIA